MKKLITILILVVSSNSIFAQTCTKADTENVPGVWKPGIKSTISLSGADLIKAKSVTPIADNMMRPGFEVPKGLEATYFSAYLGFNNNLGNNLAQYYYINRFNHFMCYNNQVTRNPDSQIILRITFNDPGIIFSRDVLPGEWQENEKDHFGWLDNFPDQKNGIIYTKATPDSAQFTRQPDRWLLTYDGKLPYAYVTRLEYLQKRKEKLDKSYIKENELTKSIYPIRPKAEQEKEKAEVLQKYRRGC